MAGFSYLDEENGYLAGLHELYDRYGYPEIVGNFVKQSIDMATY